MESLLGSNEYQIKSCVRGVNRYLLLTRSSKKNWMDRTNAAQGRGKNCSTSPEMEPIIDEKSKKTIKPHGLGESRNKPKMEGNLILNKSIQMEIICCYPVCSKGLKEI